VLFRAIENRKYLIGADQVVSLYELLIAIAYGSACNREFDIISLSVWGNLPRTTCQREVNHLIALNLVERKKDGRRYLLNPTENAILKIEKHLLNILTLLEDFEIKPK